MGRGTGELTAARVTMVTDLGTGHFTTNPSGPEPAGTTDRHLGTSHSLFHHSPRRRRTPFDGLQDQCAGESRWAGSIPVRPRQCPPTPGNVYGASLQIFISHARSGSFDHSYSASDVLGHERPGFRAWSTLDLAFVRAQRPQRVESDFSGL